MRTATIPDISREELEREVALYREARAARLTAEKGWLSLIGKFWLTPGAHRIGSAQGSEVLLPADRAPARLGTVSFADGVARLDAEPAADLRARGQQVSSLVLRSDAEPDPDNVVHGSLTLQLIRRGDDYAIRVRDVRSPARTSFPGIPAYPVDPSWRVVAKLARFDREREIVFDDSDGRPQPYLAPGVARFEREGSAFELVPVYESDRKRLFVLFADGTNRDATYGAGRFLYAPLPEGDEILLDFNKSFNPPCAFTPYAVCPLPHRENRLPIRVEAGEKRPGAV